jgi:hypothetical protein
MEAVSEIDNKNDGNGVCAMQVNLKEFLNETGLEEQMYPGKRVVRKLAQPGENKSHCVVYDWRAPETLRIDIKAGLSGKDLSRKDLGKYPISFQAPTYLEIDTSVPQIADAVNDEAAASEEEGEEGDEEGEEGSGKGSGGGKKIGAKKTNLMFQAFSTVVEGKIPSLGEVTKLVVLGKEIAKEAFGSVMKVLAAQIKNMAVVPVNILASVTKVTLATPGGRPMNELAQGQIEGADVKYKPKDMFGVGGP